MSVLPPYHAAVTVFSGEEQPYSGVRLTLKVFGRSRFNTAFELCRDHMLCKAQESVSLVLLLYHICNIENIGREQEGIPQKKKKKCIEELKSSYFSTLHQENTIFQYFSACSRYSRMYSEFFSAYNLADFK